MRTGVTPTTKHQNKKLKDLQLIDTEERHNMKSKVNLQNDCIDT